MSQLSLTLACWNYDRCNPLLDGSIEIPGVTLTTSVLPPGKLFPLAVSAATYDITEMSASSYLMQVASGNSAYQAIPVFVSRAFRHGGIYVRKDRFIQTPKDIEGKRVGVPEYQMTMALWVRGILSDEYGVETDKLRYRTGGTNKAGRKERLPLELPDRMDVSPIDETRTLNDLLVDGELDAIITPEPPLAFQQGHVNIGRLIADPLRAERDYFRKSAMFPIMHLIGIRKTVIAENPGLAGQLHHAFVEARRMTMNIMKDAATASANRVHLPWFSAEWEATIELMGAEFWPYGVSENRKELEAMCRYSYEQHLTSRHMDVEELFAPETLTLPGV